MNATAYCKNCRHTKPNEEFKNANMPNQTKQCKKCLMVKTNAKKRKLEAFKILKLDTLLYCKTCCRTRESTYFQFNGKEHKTCNDCRNNVVSRKKAKFELHKSEITIAQCDQMQVCSKCLETKKFEEFKTLENGSVSKMCVFCIEYCATAKLKNTAQRRSKNLIRELQINNTRQKKRYAKKLDRDLFFIYQYQAKERSIDFSLSYEESVILFNSLCFYCGTKTFKNGIDRVKNSLGYESENVVSCCSKCNRMKSDWSYESFISFCGHISAFNGRNGILCFERLFNTKNVRFYAYVANAAKKNRAMTLSKQQFMEITSLPCYLCGKLPSTEHKNGVDRVDSNLGYIDENCKSCCASCNFMKSNTPLLDFLNHCERIYNNKNSTLTILQTPFFKEKRIKNVIKLL